jgi:hypothetical protein
MQGMNLASLGGLRELKIKESACEAETPTPPKVDPKDCPKTIDAMQDHFSTLLGKTKAPLAYVIHGKAALPDEADNPPEK